MQFGNDHGFFDARYSKPSSPPVFVRSEAWRNVIVNPNASEAETKRLLELVPQSEWHKWYGSMNSSQALAQSVLGNLFLHGDLETLRDLKDDDDLDLFGAAKLSSDNFFMEHKADAFNEPHPTSLDGFISGEYQIAIECKFTETEIGSCSRPRLKSGDASYCNGSFSKQKSRNEKCSLTEIGIQYWKYIPQLFNWKTAEDLNPCPLNANYQLARNILAVGVKNDGVSLNGGHAVLIYDERNPAFQQNGDGLRAYAETKQALIRTTMLRKCSWQKIVSHLRTKNILPWLTENLHLKYGL